MTTYLTWLAPDGKSADMPSGTCDLCPVCARGPSAAAAIAARRSDSRMLSVVVGVVRADLMRAWATWSRRYVVRFNRVVAETRRLP